MDAITIHVCFKRLKGSKGMGLLTVVPCVSKGKTILEESNTI